MREKGCERIRAVKSWILGLFVICLITVGMGSFAAEASLTENPEHVFDYAGLFDENAGTDLEELAGQLAAKGTISATAQGAREAVLAAAASVPGLTDLRVTAEKGGEVSFTAVSEAGTDLRGALSLALAKAGCPVLTLSAESMSLEDVFLQLTEKTEEKEEA